MSLPIEFKPKKNFSLIRLGRDNDGGYLIGFNSVKSAKTLISFGRLFIIIFMTLYQIV